MESGRPFEVLCKRSKTPKAVICNKYVIPDIVVVHNSNSKIYMYEDVVLKISSSKLSVKLK